MSLSTQDCYWHRVYEAMTESARNCIDNLYESLQTDMGRQEMIVAHDDRAECLVAAITRYVVESAGCADIRAGLTFATVPLRELCKVVKLCETTDAHIDSLSLKRREEINAALIRDHAFLKSLGLSVSAQAPTI